MSFNESLNDLRELVAYNVIYAPGSYREEDQATWAQEYERMHVDLKLLLNRCRSSNKVHWLQLALNDLEKANQMFKEEEETTGIKYLQSCEDYLNSAASGKKHTIDFIVGVQGTEPTRE